MRLPVAFAAGSVELQAQQKLPAGLDSVRTALSRYSDPYLAVKDGFLSTVACIDFPTGAVDGPVEYPPGAMGVHFINMANVGPKLDPAKPQVLIYEPANGKLNLVAAEWFMPVQLAGAAAPEIFGQKLAGPMEGHEPIMPAELPAPSCGTVPRKPSWNGSMPMKSCSCSPASTQHGSLKSNSS